MRHAGWIVAVMGLMLGCGGDGGASGPDAGEDVLVPPVSDAAPPRDASGVIDAGRDAADASATPDAPPPLMCGVLESGQELDQGQEIKACSNAGFGTIYLSMQTDGNLVLYQDDVCTQPTWASNTYMKGGYKAVMQPDGDLVVQSSSNAVLWSSGTSGNPGATLAVQSDGNLVIYTTTSKPIWSTGTWHEKPTNKLWIAQDGATSDSSIESYWRIVLEMSTNFTRMESVWKYGRPLAFGGYKVLGTPCSVIQSTGASVSQDSSSLQCIENQTGWEIASGDIILYFPQGYGCDDGRNHWNIPVTHGGTSYSVEAAFGFTGAAAWCQQPLGLHEVYEASSDASGADCCNGQDGCPATPSPYGWYNFSACGTTWGAQTVAPSAADEYSASACTKLQF